MAMTTAAQGGIGALKVLALIPPMTQLNTPYPSTAYLTGFLRGRGVDAVQADLALALVLKLFSRDGLGQIRELLFKLPSKKQKAKTIRHFLDQFDPKPKIWSIAKTKLAEAEGLLQKMIKDAEFNLNVYYKRKQHAEAIEECNKLMLILDPEQTSYQKARDYKITFEKQLSLEKKKGKR